MRRLLCTGFLLLAACSNTSGNSTQADAAPSQHRPPVVIDGGRRDAAVVVVDAGPGVPDAAILDAAVPPDAAPTWDAAAWLATQEGPRSPGVTLEIAEAAKRRALQRRDERLVEALLPGNRWASLRVEQEAISTGVVDWRRTVDIGRAIFEHPMTTRIGLGNNLAGVDPVAANGVRPNFRRFQKGDFGGPDTTTCLSCHWKGGVHGAGERVDNTYMLGDGDALATHDERNPPPLLGLGWVQLAAQEMSAELQAQRDNALVMAHAGGDPVEVRLTAKGVAFGRILARPDGTVDTTNLDGVDADLVIKPFGWKGTFATIRRFCETSLQVHLGMQAESLVQEHVRDGIPGRVGRGPNPLDPDNDGVLREVTDGQLTALELFLATLETGISIVPPETPWQERWTHGQALFDEVGCTACHLPSLPVDGVTYTSYPDVGTHAPVSVDLEAHAAAPKPSRDPLSGKLRVFFFSDFKRHNMGDHLAGPNIDHGVGRAWYLTRRLWGLAKSSPYLYNGSAGNLDEAILAHGGEAEVARAGYQALGVEERAAIQVFLMAMTRQPDVIVR